MSKNIIATVTHTPILHNGKRYEVGSQIALSQAEFDRLAYYVQIAHGNPPLADELDQQAQAESEKADAETVKPKRTRSKA